MSRFSRIVVGLVFFCSVAQAGPYEDRAVCLPFFDYSGAEDISNIVTNYESNQMQKGMADLSPEPLQVTRLGEAILRTCGAWGKKISVSEVQAVFDVAGAEVIDALRAEFGEYNETEMRDLLVSIWSKKRGFEHIFCGQPKTDKIGGLHYYGRYYDLQLRKSICRMPNNDREEILPGLVFTVGVLSSIGKGDAKKGYSTLQTAEDIVVEASRDYLLNCNTGRRARPNQPYTACLSRFRDGSIVSQFVCSAGEGIVTFYPLARNTASSARCRQ